jgi:hypothetical protein
MWDPHLFWAECYSKIIERMIYKINFSLRGNAIESELPFTTAGALRCERCPPEFDPWDRNSGVSPGHAPK